MTIVTDLWVRDGYQSVSPTTRSFGGQGSRFRVQDERINRGLWGSGSLQVDVNHTLTNGLSVRIASRLFNEKTGRMRNELVKLGDQAARQLYLELHARFAEVPKEGLRARRKGVPK